MKQIHKSTWNYIEKHFYHFDIGSAYLNLPSQALSLVNVVLFAETAVENDISVIVNVYTL